jgi:hypothetical protein
MKSDTPFRSSIKIKLVYSDSDSIESTFLINFLWFEDGEKDFK